MTKLTPDDETTSRSEEWFKDLVSNTGVAYTTLLDWWRAFCKTINISLTPKQALTIHQQQFFDWLQGKSDD